MVSYYTTGNITLIENKCLKCAKTPPLGEVMLTENGWGLCHDCILEFYTALEKITAPEKDKTLIGGYFTPQDIVKHLDKYIIGQKDAKKTLAIAVYQHYKLLASSPTKTVKNNVLIMGSTGSGKTALVEKLADYLGVPFVIYDCTMLTETGYVGDDIDDIFKALLQKANGDLSLAQLGIVVLDEVDKIGTRESSTTKDTTGFGVQRSLLKTLESSVLSIPPGNKRMSGQGDILFDTSNVLFIGAGAFSTIPTVINKRLADNSSGIGFGASVQSKNKTIEYDELISKVEPEDIIKYGFMPEFLGRFAQITHTKTVDKDTMVRILRDTKDSVLKQTINLFSIDHVELTVSDKAMGWIAEQALKRSSGARALKGIISDLLKDVMYIYPSNSDILDVVIDVDEGGKILVKMYDCDGELSDGYEEDDLFDFDKAREEAEEERGSTE